MKTNTIRYAFCLVAALSFSILMGPAPDALANSRIVAVVNGAVVTDFDVSQRQKLEKLLSGGRKRLGKSATKALLVDDKLKLFEARERGMTPGDKEISNAINNMAKNVRMKRKQMLSVVNRAGISTKTLKSWMKVNLAWQSLIRARFNAQVNINEGEIIQALSKSKKSKDDVKAAIRYDLSSVTFITRKKASKSEANKKLAEAKRFRASFANCETGLKAARSLRDVAVNRIGRRMSSDLPPAIEKTLRNTGLNKLTVPKKGRDGYEMFAVCGKKDMGKDETLRSAMKSELEDKRGRELSRKYLRELRSRAVIEYR